MVFKRKAIKPTTFDGVMDAGAAQAPKLESRWSDPANTEETGMKRVLMGIAAASLLIGAAAVTPAKALPAAPGVIGEPITSSSNAQPAAWVCWWRYGRRVCAWRGHRHWGYHRRHWRHRRW
jgi:hypothetical protein